MSKAIFVVAALTLVFCASLATVAGKDEMGLPQKLPNLSAQKIKAPMSFSAMNRVESSLVAHVGTPDRPGSEVKDEESEILPAVLFISLVVAVAPMVGMLFFIWWIDRYDREPLRYVFVSFAWGAFGATIFSAIGSQLGLQFFGELSPERELVVGSVILAPTVEELAKGLIIFLLLRRRDFDNATDGLVYGAASGLGFGMTENFLYFMLYASEGTTEEWLNLLFIRSVFTAYMHSAATATFGAGISRLKTPGLRAVLSVIGFYVVAWGLHATWNALAMEGEKSPESAGVGLLLLIVYFGIIFLLFVFGVRKERKQREKLLEEEFASGVLPPDFRKIFCSYRLMTRSDWFPGYLNKDRYLSLISRLAMCKSAYAKATESRRKVIDVEIDGIRQELKRFSDLIIQIPK